MASNQCGNCGEVGHFRASCPHPKNESLEHWKTARAQFRRENPEELRKLKERKEENQRWKEEGRTISFAALNAGVKKVLEMLHELEQELDILGRPNDWKEANKKLDDLLPLVREISNIGKGFVFYNRMPEVVVDGDIFLARLSDMTELRDDLVATIKSFFNGQLGKLAEVNSRNDPQALLRYIYEKHPPLRAYQFEGSELNGSTLKRFLKTALLHYHPDKQEGSSKQWQTLCESITRCLTSAFSKC